jgi:hypothetical protein
MVGNSKILTVSYGTFSCTLEGFDDPFSTMRSIAEYFRDLAADDRYFGAEPPTPDAEMLHRIAEREVRRRVESRVEGNGVVLRPAADDPAPAAADEADADERLLARIADGADQPETAPAERGADDPSEAGAPALAPPADDGIAEKLQRIRAAVAGSQAATTGAGLYTEDEHAEDDTAAADVAEAPVTDDATTRMLAPETLAETAPAEAAPAAEEPAPAPAEAETAEAAVAANDVTPEPERAELEPAPAMPEPAPAAEEDTREEGLGFDISSLFQDEDKPAGAPADAAAEEDDANAPLELAPEQKIEDAPTPAPLRARVVKMRREEFEAAFEPDEDTEEEARETELREELGATGLSEEDEAALIAELAAAEDDAGSDAAEAEAAPGEPAARKPEMPASDDSVDRILARTDTELDKEDGNRRRSAIEHLRAAVAAVRAEGGQDGRVEETEAEKGRYREDLARVVRPERPAARPEGEPARKMPPLMLVSEQRVDRPAADTPRAEVQPRRPGGDAATLMDESGDDTPESDNIFGEVQDFSAFASQFGATDMPDLIEAAAAYSAYVEGKPETGRSELMRLVMHHLPKEAANREELMRAFGTILRDGRLKKIRRGVFTIAEGTRFQPDKAAASG